jgi:hypothetical protein
MPSLPLGGKNRFDFPDRNFDVIIDNDIVVLCPMPDFADGFGHARPDDIERILSPLRQPALKFRMSGRQNEDRDKILVIVLPELLRALPIHDK